MNKFLPIILFSLSIISPSLANDTFSVNHIDSADINTIKQKAIAKTQQQNLDFIKMFDDDHDGKLSAEESIGSFETIEKINLFTPSEISDLKKRITAAFKNFDIDNDGYLSSAEVPTYITYIEDQTLTLMTSKMDIDGDGQITGDELLLYVQSLPSLEESLKKLREMATKLQNK